MDAGTPLGDPIEVGAIGQVLSGQESGSRALALGSVKSAYGHTEGAAGLTGVLLAYNQLSSSYQPGIKHLRSLNPYVQAAFLDWKQSHHADSVIKRQVGPAIEGLTAGTSSFGMSGINAHAILRSRGTVEEGIKSCLPWRRHRCWPRPQAHALLLSVTVTRGIACFACNLKTPRLAYLAEFQVESHSTLPTFVVVGSSPAKFLSY